jgi:hypothetical protein
MWLAQGTSLKNGRPVTLALKKMLALRPWQRSDNGFFVDVVDVVCREDSDLVAVFLL